MLGVFTDALLIKILYTCNAHTLPRMKFDTKILPVSINDLKDKYFDGSSLTKEEELALTNFDHYRIQKLNATKSDAEFKLCYLKIQAMANLKSYRYFLNIDLLQSC
jgi:hypothetical protein